MRTPQYVPLRLTPVWNSSISWRLRRLRTWLSTTSRIRDGVPRPVAGRVLLGLDLAAGVADQHGRKRLKSVSRPEIVVDAAVAQHGAPGEGGRSGQPRSSPAPAGRCEFTGDNTGGNAEEAATAVASFTRGCRTSPTR